MKANLTLQLNAAGILRAVLLGAFLIVGSSGNSAKANEPAPATDEPGAVILSNPPSVLPPKATPRAIYIEAEILHIDQAALQKSKIDLDETFSESHGKAPRTASSSSARGKKGWFAAVVSQREFGLLSKLLRTAKAAETLSRPSIMTLNGQEAQVQVGGEIPLWVRDETVNGNRRVTTETRSVGLHLTITPRIVEDGRIRLTIAAEHSTLLENGNADAGAKLPSIRSRRMETTIEAPIGQTIVLSERAPDRAGDADSEKLLMLAMSVIEAPRNPRRPTLKSARSRLRLEKGVAHVLEAQQPVSRLHITDPGVLKATPISPKKLLLHAPHAGKTTLALFGENDRANLIDVTVSSDSAEQPATNSVNESAANSQDAPRSHAKNRGTVRGELRALREEVKGLRGDVARMIGILESQSGAATEKNPDLPRATAPPAQQAPSASPPTSDLQPWETLGMRLREAANDESSIPGRRYRGALIVTEIRENGPADVQGIRPGGRLVGLGRWETKSLKNLAFVLNQPDADGNKPLKFYVVRDGETMYGHLDLQAPPGESATTDPPRPTALPRRTASPVEPAPPISRY